ncbi:hypothetical protein WH47_02347 [Habropoda laboriosa]|uniref:Uncharacterized protein n=1 Tax=Habropoda laboriosa TaxID=597456 RepID=A0A0L7QZP7_9HYME|nr:hypothetical protein WH47_02347 [Habropoda laboriosa]
MILRIMAKISRMSDSQNHPDGSAAFAAGAKLYIYRGRTQLTHGIHTLFRHT